MAEVHLPTSALETKVSQVEVAGPVVAAQYMRLTQLVDRRVSVEQHSRVETPLGRVMARPRRRVAEVVQAGPEPTQHPESGELVVLEPSATSQDSQLPMEAAVAGVNARPVAQLDLDVTAVEVEAFRQQEATASSAAVAAALVAAL